jgi:hypothetical protein
MEKNFLNTVHYGIQLHYAYMFVVGAVSIPVKGAVLVGYAKCIFTVLVPYVYVPKWWSVPWSHLWSHVPTGPGDVS